MYTPHTVTLISAEETDNGTVYYPVILSGVFLDLAKRSNINKSGLSDADAATLFIPFGVNAWYPAEAEDGLAIAGEAVAGIAIAGKTKHFKSYLTPKAFDADADKRDHWTIFDDGSESGAGCYFIKGEITEDYYPYSRAREKHDYVYQVSSVDLRDFGSQRMQHWMVGGK